MFGVAHKSPFLDYIAPSDPLIVFSPLKVLANVSALKQIQQDDDNSDDKKQVNESAQCVRRDQAKKPEDDQYDGNGVKHGSSPAARCSAENRLNARYHEIGAKTAYWLPLPRQSLREAGIV